jgi:hypothetical protein
VLSARIVAATASLVAVGSGELAMSRLALVSAPKPTAYSWAELGVRPDGDDAALATAQTLKVF